MTLWCSLIGNRRIENEWITLYVHFFTQISKQISLIFWFYIVYVYMDISSRLFALMWFASWMFLSWSRFTCQHIIRLPSSRHHAIFISSRVSCYFGRLIFNLSTLTVIGTFTFIQEHFMHVPVSNMKLHASMNLWKL